MVEKFLYVHKVAKRLSCSNRHVYKLIRDGELKAIRLGTRALRITESSLESFVKKNRVDPEEYYE